MSCGSACIGTNVHGINSLLEHEENGYLCETNPQSIRNAIIKLYSNKPLRQKLGRNARQYILDNCSLDIISEKEYLFYKEILYK